MQCTGHLVTQENSYSIANINLETIDAVQKNNTKKRQTTATTTMLFRHMRVQLHASTATAAIEGR